MDPLKYGVDDFLCDITFHHYCLGTVKKDVLFWEEWLLQHPERRGMVSEARKLYIALNGHTNEQHFKTDYAYFLQEFSSHLQNGAAPRLKKGRNRLLYLTGIAASIVLVLGIYLVWRLVPGANKSAVAFSVPAGKKRRVLLPDGTTVTLNASSKLRLGKDFNKKDRNIQFEGEGYFSVAHNKLKPFIIHTDKVNLRVLGTIFNMRAFPGDKTVETTLLSGAVEITLNSATHTKLRLVPNEKFVLNAKQQVSVKPLPVMGIQTVFTEIDWTKNKLSFQDKSLEDIVPDIERWYGVEIDIVNPAYRANTYTASFDNEALDQVLNSLQLTGGFKYRKEESGKIIIY